MVRWRREPCPCCTAQPDWVCEAPAEPGPSRRGLLSAALGLATVGLVRPAFAAPGDRSIGITRIGTGDSFNGVYWRDGRYDTEALRQLNWVMRDPHLDEATPMDPRLFDVLNAVAGRMDTSPSYEVVSGYRAPETNAANARRSRRVSRQSLHMSGMAADVRLPGRSSMGMARLAAEMQMGGVGLYRRDGFVHLDCGPSRRW
jgi:uncharacterized protein YcbK (DUF882 family)